MCILRRGSLTPTRLPRDLGRGRIGCGGKRAGLSVGQLRKFVGVSNTLQPCLEACVVVDWLVQILVEREVPAQLIDLHARVVAFGCLVKDLRKICQELRCFFPGCRLGVVLHEPPLLSRCGDQRLRAPHL